MINQKLMTLQEAEKNIENMAERVINPEFLNQIWFMGGLLLGWSFAYFMKGEFTIISILLFLCGIVLSGCVWYVRKNFEWKKEEDDEPTIPNQPNNISMSDTKP